MHSKQHILIGKYLEVNSNPKDIVVVNEIGAIGYFSKLPVIDMLGLIDTVIPQLLYREHDLDIYADYILKCKPRFILLNDKQHPGDRRMHPIHAAIYNKMVQTGDYFPGPIFPLNSYKNILVFVRAAR